MVSLESVDGPLYASMISDFHSVLAALPPASALASISQVVLEEMMARDEARFVMDADAVAAWSVACISRYLFGEGGAALVEPLVAASWEWRREIAVRGKGDPQVKQRAIAALVAQLERSAALWPLFGERWREPRYYSLLLQPFLLSPCINLGDIAVAVKTRPHLDHAEDAVRAAHPFPILERYVGKDLRAKDGSLAVRADTQVIIFTADLDASRSSKSSGWPVFGVGPRQCAGAHLARPMIQLLHNLRAHDRFDPAKGHRLSGRNNDANWSWAERYYFATTIGAVLRDSALRRGKGRSHKK